MYKVGVIGLGYVGLTLAVHLAQRGCTVIGIEISEPVLSSIGKGEAHFFEEDFNSHLADSVNNGKLEATSDYSALGGCDVVFLTLGTPLGANGGVSLEPLALATSLLSEFISAQTLVIVRSTVKIGTTRNVVLPNLGVPASQVLLAYCPERTLEGKALQELASLPQIVAGINDKSQIRASEFFESLGNVVVALPELEEAELAKLVNNTERDLMFGFANEIALACQTNNLDAHRVINAANQGYPRSNIKRPGPVGGPCLEKDPHILHESFSGLGQVSLFNVGRGINESMISAALDHAINSHFKEERPLTNALILGFAFKGLPPTGDLRGSLVFELIRHLTVETPGITISGHDYLADISMIPSVLAVPEIKSAIAAANLIILQNNHPRYKSENWFELSASMGPGTLIFDFWNQLDPSDIAEHVTYLAFGGQYVEK